MNQADIRRPATLAEQIKRVYPELEGSVGATTLNRMKRGNAIELHTGGIIAICRYFRLKSIAQLVDLADAEPYIQAYREDNPDLGIEFRIQNLMQELNISQKRLTDKSGCSPATINNLYHGRNETVNFRVLADIATAIRGITENYSGGYRPRSITELIEILPVTAKTALTIPAH